MATASGRRNRGIIGGMVASLRYQHRIFLEVGRHPVSIRSTLASSGSRRMRASFRARRRRRCVHGLVDYRCGDFVGRSECPGKPTTCIPAKRPCDLTQIVRSRLGEPVETTSREESQNGRIQNRT